MLFRSYWLPAGVANILEPGLAFSMVMLGGWAPMSVRAISFTLSTQKVVVPVWPQVGSPDHILRTTPATVSIFGAFGLIGKTKCSQPPVVGRLTPPSQFWE